MRVVNMAETTSTPVVGEDDEQGAQYGFSRTELEYLLSVTPGPSADRGAKLLRVAPVASVDESILIGGAALLSRGLLEFRDGGEFAPVEEAMIIAFILGTATRWSTIAPTADDQAGAAVFIESPGGGVLAHQGPLSTWWFVILDPDAVAGEVVLGVAMGLAHEEAASGVVVQTATLEHDRTFSLRRDGDSWSYAHGDTGSPEPEAMVQDASLDDVIIELASFAAYFPQMR